ncbi:phosphate acyltransferase PlsX [Sulfuriflexus mobilis]|uniref:phosphate acyltransferase PlsX n=1 Tax=Sulfuriflexus mobilis TaxID=1811807 RepID=UPI0018D528F5|nr:phosphate acyltransferase PlsX [Sulfuriflexus mobilis]
MGNPVTISLDAMGGDHGPSVVIPAALQALDDNPDLSLILVGDEEVLHQHLQQSKREPGERLRLQHASQQVDMCELPSHALRNKKDSSMRVAINLVKEGQADACVSAGNTGALMATARFVLKMLSTVDRPAICGILPTIGGHTHMLDLGANVDATADNLFEFAVMGSVLASAVDNIENPSVGLLNIGEEEIKGNERIKEASRLLTASQLNYVGYIEADGIYSDKANVVVCDGFNGNIALKASEGVAKMISHKIREAFSKNILTKLVALVAMPVLNSFRKTIDPRRYNGASLLGLQGIVIKSHGGADVLAFKTAINTAIVEVHNRVPERISEQLETLLSGQRNND